MDWLVVVGVVGLFGGWLAIMVVWGLTGRRSKARIVGISPFYKQTALEDEEVVISELGAICRIARGAAYPGMLFFTDRSLMFTPARNWDAPISGRIDYTTITAWFIEKRRQLGIGSIVPFRSPALVVMTSDAREHVYWAAPGYDIVKPATQAMPSAVAENAGSEFRT